MNLHSAFCKVKLCMIMFISLQDCILLAQEKCKCRLELVFWVHKTIG